MASTIFKLKCIEYFEIFFASFLAMGMCQDLVITSNLSLSEDANNTSMESNVIPESLLIQLGSVQNVSELFRRFVTVGDQAIVFETSDTNSTERRAYSAGTAAAVAQPANCQTEQHVIELDRSESGSIIFWPSCVRVRRCGGCCASTMLSCKPLATSILSVTVLQMFYNHQNPNSFQNQGTKTFSLEQHDRCSCSCKEVAEDCDPDVHEYRPHECKCVCTNKEEAAACTGSKKIWDSRSCSCKCRKIRLCSTDFSFSDRTCRCEISRRSLAVQPIYQQNSTVSLSSEMVTV